MRQSHRNSIHKLKNWKRFFFRITYNEKIHINISREKIINEKAENYTMLTRFNNYPATHLKIRSFDDNNINQKNRT